MKAFNDISSNDKDSFQGNLYITPNEWHLISFIHHTEQSSQHHHHLYGYHSAKIEIYIDSIQSIEHELKYHII